MKMLGVDVGPCRLPLAPLSPEEVVALGNALEAIGFFHWAAPQAAAEAPGS